MDPSLSKMTRYRNKGSKTKDVESPLTVGQINPSYNSMVRIAPTSHPDRELNNEQGRITGTNFSSSKCQSPEFASNRGSSHWEQNQYNTAMPG